MKRNCIGCNTGEYCMLTFGYILQGILHCYAIILFVTWMLFFSFDLFMVYIPECKQQLRTMKQYTQIQDIVHYKSGL
jgi:hypothetical protein